MTFITCYLSHQTPPLHPITTPLLPLTATSLLGVEAEADPSDIRCSRLLYHATKMHSRQPYTSEQIREARSPGKEGGTRPPLLLRQHPSSSSPSLTPFLLFPLRQRGEHEAWHGGHIHRARFGESQGSCENEHWERYPRRARSPTRAGVNPMPVGEALAPDLDAMHREQECGGERTYGY